MPLGIARSVLTTAAPAASGGTHYGWTTNNVANSDNMASYRWTGADFTTNNLMSVVMWFRANGADADGDADDWIDGTSGGGSGSYFLQMIKDTGNSDFFRFWFTLQDFGWQMTMLDETNAYIDGRGFGKVYIIHTDSCLNVINVDGTIQLIFQLPGVNTSKSRNTTGFKYKCMGLISQNNFSSPWTVNQDRHQISHGAAGNQ